MQGKLSLFLIISFFSMQMLSLLHMAEHDFEKHEHNGDICTIYLHYEQGKYADTVVANLGNTTVYDAYYLTLFYQADLASQPHTQAYPRAPPFFS